MRLRAMRNPQHSGPPDRLSKALSWQTQMQHGTSTRPASPAGVCHDDLGVPDTDLTDGRIL